ncbi:MAG: glutamate 5-kinase [Sulfurimonas sp.]|jgi:glutamate 5-kinase|uniref:glutamate 5-kinase n=1 Tax=Sulfurimonas sp. TaxID=2022749 RepID=UPI0039E34083
MKRIVVKVGSAVLTKDDSIALERVQALIDFLVDLKKSNEVILVSSGAVSAGYTELKLDRNIIQNKQALASIGQPILMGHYRKRFAPHNILCSQVLVTSLNLNKEDDVKRIQNTIDTLLSNGVIPIINENDATSTEELEVGDNDQLSAYIAKDTNADILILLSDIDAYYDKDPHKHDDAKVLKIVEHIPSEELEKNVTPNNVFATGGIVTKLKAAQYMLDNNISMFLSTGFDLSDVKSYMIDGIHKGGTLFKVKN